VEAEVARVEAATTAGLVVGEVMKLVAMAVEGSSG